MEDDLNAASSPALCDTSRFCVISNAVLCSLAHHFPNPPVTSPLEHKLEQMSLNSKPLLHHLAPFQALSSPQWLSVQTMLVRPHCSYSEKCPACQWLISYKHYYRRHRDFSSHPSELPLKCRLSPGYIAFRIDVITALFGLYDSLLNIFQHYQYSSHVYHPA